MCLEPRVFRFGTAVREFTVRHRIIVYGHHLQADLRHIVLTLTDELVGGALSEIEASRAHDVIGRLPCSYVTDFVSEFSNVPVGLDDQGEVDLVQEPEQVRNETQKAQSRALIQTKTLVGIFFERREIVLLCTKDIS